MDAKRQALKQYFGYESFRPGQEALMDAILSGRDALCVMPTGGGKSLCYQLPALLMEGTSLVISPLISLMKDQVSALRQSGIPAAYLNSSLTPEQYQKALSLAWQGFYKIIYVAPERLLSEEFLAFARHVRPTLLAVDEAHCVSQWGHDFRPNYLDVPRFVSLLPQRPPVAAFTATATPVVSRDIENLLALQAPYRLILGYNRPNLRFEVLRLENAGQRDPRLLSVLAEMPGKSGIIYCATRAHVEKICALLLKHGYPATRYHAGLSPEERLANQDAFARDERPVMVATNAFGMGIDKSNVSFVIHYQMPKDLEGYYQEAGRAGRDGMPARCVLLFGQQDIMIHRHMITGGKGGAKDPAGQPMALERLRHMIQFCQEKRCLRGAILRYFGEKAPVRCGNCGNCNPALYYETEEAPLGSRPIAMAHTSPSESDEQGLYKRLVALRLSLAQNLKVPAYVVFTNSTLFDMAKQKPQNEEELLRVSGMNVYKLAQFGPAFLKEIAAYQKGEL